MAVAAQPPSQHGTSGRRRLSPDELHELAPIVRLLTAIWMVPQVTKVAVATGEAITNVAAVDIWVFMSEEDYEAEAAISRAERAFLNENPGFGFLFTLNVVPGQDIAPEMIPRHTVLLER